MIETLPLFHRIAGQPVIVLGQGPAAEPKRRLVERAGGVVHDDIASGIDHGARLAFVAHDDQAMCEGDALRLRGAGLLVNVVDRPELCDFTTPSILDRSPVLIAVGTNGASAGLAKALRLRLEQILPPSLGPLARALGAARGALRARFPDAGDRRRALDGALATGGALDPFAAGEGEVARWLADPAPGEQAGRIDMPIHSADPEDLTLRQARLLGSADVILHGDDVPLAILDRARADALRIAMDAGGHGNLGGLIVVVRMARPNG